METTEALPAQTYGSHKRHFAKQTQIGTLKKIFYLTFLLISVVITLINHYFHAIKIIPVSNDIQRQILSFTSTIFFMFAIILFIPFDKIPKYIFDPNELKRAKNTKKFIYKLRLRALLFNNISVLAFISILIIILVGFNFLIDPINAIDFEVKPKIVKEASLAIQIGSSVLLIFLVSILFRVFKYLLRVAAFYNSKADAIEFFELEQKSRIGLKEIMELFTPDKYDISDIEQPSIIGKVVNPIK